MDLEQSLYFVISISLAIAALNALCNEYFLLPYKKESEYLLQQKDPAKRVKIIPALKNRRRLLLWICLPLFLLMIWWGFYLIEIDLAFNISSTDFARIASRRRGMGIIFVALRFLPQLLFHSYPISVNLMSMIPGF